MSLPGPLDLDLKVIKKGTGKLLRYRELKRQIRPLIKIVQNGPLTEVEEKIFEVETVNDSELQDETLIRKAEALSEELQPKIEAQEELAKELWEQVISNWNELEENRDLSLEITNGRIDIINALRDLIRKQNHAKERQQELIVKHILEIREELVETWTQCMVQSAEDAGFVQFHRTDYTKDLLELHAKELTKWKGYLSKHQQLFDQIEKRTNLWQRMKELQLKAEDPNRFVNRGGALLQTQKEQNYVNAALPKCEEKLKAMAKNFEKENGRKLLIHGMDIADLIRKDWEEYRREIKERAAAKPPLVRSHSRAEVPSSLRTGERNPVLRERRPVSAEKRKARETLGRTASVKKAKSCKSLVSEDFPKRRRSST